MYNDNNFIYYNIALISYNTIQYQEFYIKNGIGHKLQIIFLNNS